jgi:hypothetical protein
MRRLIIVFALAALVGFNTMLGYSIYKKVNTPTSDIVPLLKKFGTMPTNPKLEPIVHLALLGR